MVIRLATSNVNCISAILIIDKGACATEAAITFKFKIKSKMNFRKQGTGP
jgi:hypothetical protein